MPQNVKCELLDWSEVVAGERKALSRRRRSQSQGVSQYFLGLRACDLRTSCRHMDRMR
jgi:hypothetical protein